MTELGPSPPARASNFLHDEDLATLLGRRGKLRVAESADLLMPVVSALASAHDAGTPHGDLTPRNIMLTQRDASPVSYVIGFGSAKLPERSVQRARDGKVRIYLAPEQVREAPEVTARSDQFAVGAVLYECLTGEPPFAASSAQDAMAQVRACKYPRPRTLAPSIPRALEAALVRAMARRPEKRFASMRDLGAALLPFASEPVQRAHVAALGPAVSARRSAGGSPRHAERSTARDAVPARGARAQRRGLLGVAAAALGVLALISIGALRSDETEPRARPPAAAHPSVPAPAAAAVRGEEVAEERPRPAPVRREHASDQPATNPEAPAAPTRAPGALRIDLTVEPPSAWIMLDRKAAGMGRLQRSLPIDGKEHDLHVGAPGYVVQTFRFKDAPPPRTVVLEKRGKRPETQGAPRTGVAPSGSAGTRDVSDRS